MDKIELKNKISKLEGLTNDEKSALINMLNHEKKYGLVWEDKPEEVEERLRDELPVLREVKERAIVSNADDAPNHILIEGDNLEALTALSYTHAGKIDVIYIDPPYNTGNKDFVYNDSFVDSEDSFRHSKWLSFMDRRLKLAKGLLSDKGVIFISIDDNEQAQLKLLCDEVFGMDCFMGNISWQRTYSTRNDKKGFVREVEYIISYAKSATWMPNKLERTAEMNSKYKNPDNDVAPWRADNAYAPNAVTHQGMVYAIQHPITGDLLYPSNASCWRYEQKQMLDYMSGWCDYELRDIDDAEKRAEICGIATKDVRTGVKAIMLKDSLDISRRKAKAVYNRGQWPRFYFTKGGNGGIARKTYLNHVTGTPPTNLFSYAEVGHTDEAKKEIQSLFEGKSLFSTPKPTRLLKRIMQVGSNSNSTILDFFAGSGTTLHATMQLNKEDGGHRKCILVTNNENGICENVTYERNKRVINGYTTPKGEEVEGLHDNTLRYYKTEFISRDQSPKNMRALVAASTDLLCIKNDIYTEADFAGRKLNKKIVRYFEDKHSLMLVIYDERAIGAIVELLETVELDSRGKIKVYTFSASRYAYDDEFMEVSDKVELCALPAAIYDAYKQVLPKRKPKYLPEALFEGEVTESKNEARQGELNFGPEGGEA